LKIDLYIILPSNPGSPKWTLFLRFPQKYPLYVPLLPPHSLHALPSLSSHFITRTILGEEYRSLRSLLRIFLHAPVTSSLLVPNMLLNNLHSNILNARDQVSHSN
jgi:hypothetical protein